MREYGLENFSFDVIEECLEDELNEREIYWIKYYDTYYNGYNRTLGGTGRNLDIAQEARNLWDEGYSSAEICKKLNICRESVRKYLLGYSNYSKKESFKRGFYNSDKTIKQGQWQGQWKRKQIIPKIIRYSMEGVKIDEWISCN